MIESFKHSIREKVLMKMHCNNMKTLTSMMIFLFILTIGFIYEWKKGALDWE